MELESHMQRSASADGALGALYCNFATRNSWHHRVGIEPRNQSSSRCAAARPTLYHSAKPPPTPERALLQSLVRRLARPVLIFGPLGCDATLCGVLAQRHWVSYFGDKNLGAQGWAYPWDSFQKYCGNSASLARSQKGLSILKTQIEKG